jgi:hypothetical protein
MRDVYVAFNLGDNGGRRSGLERRRFSYSGHIPERRSGVDRRCGKDRRAGVDRRATPNRYGADERRDSDERRAVLQDRNRVPRGKEAARERRGEEFQEPLER